MKNHVFLPLEKLGKIPVSVGVRKRAQVRAGWASRWCPLSFLLRRRMPKRIKLTLRLESMLDMSVGSRPVFLFQGPSRNTQKQISATFDTRQVQFCCVCLTLRLDHRAICQVAPFCFFCNVSHLAGLVSNMLICSPNNA